MQHLQLVNGVIIIDKLYKKQYISANGKTKGEIEK